MSDVAVRMVDEKALIPEVHFIDTRVAYCSNNPDDFTRILTDLSQNARRNDLIIDLVRSLVTENRQILFVGARTESLKHLHARTSEFCKSGLFVGTTTLAQDQAMKRGIEDVSVDIVWLEKKFEKGVDAPRLDTLINAKP